ncbi:ribosomal protein S27E [Granulicella aggregans]|uniref:Ribosomal protein S27E n=1 Tax=Granulicella aggregans TaxID=474949 RepID=A0A7W7ZCU1_9BACT|nr:ribosomal protein S27E [Granulicella aggregans]
MNDSRLYLKICEGCGVLWLRTGAADGVYCRGCATTLAEFPKPNPGKCRNHRIRTASERATRIRCRVQRDSLKRPFVASASRPAGGAA